MSDGAHLNIGARGAMKTIIGGADEPPPMTDEEFEAMIRTAPIGRDDDGEFDYDGGSNAAARIVLEAYEKYPQLQGMSDERVYLRNVDGSVGKNYTVYLNVTLYDVIKKLHPEGTIEYDEVLIDLTGFMWGWAMNAARKVLGLGPVPNPALMTINVGGKE